MAAPKRRSERSKKGAPLPSILTDAQLAQRDASRRLYFVASGCLYHPQADLVLGHDPGARAALAQSIETALSFAELSDEDAAAFRERAVAETRVARRRDGSYSFEPPERPPRRRWRWTGLFRFFISSSPISVAPTDRRAEMKSRSSFLRLLGVLAAIWLLIRGVRIFDEAVAPVMDGHHAPIEVGTAVLGVALSGIAALLLWRLARPLFG